MSTKAKATVSFENVGRGKRCWTAALPVPLAFRTVMGEVRRNGGLMSRDLDLDWDDATGEGVIFAGFRPVGTFRLATSTPGASHE